MDGDRKIVRWTAENYIGTRHGSGGMSQQRFERNHEIAVQAWFKKIQGVVIEIIQKNPTTRIIVGGPGMTKNSWISSLTDNRVSSIVYSETYNTGYTDEHQGLKELAAYSNA